MDKRDGIWYYKHVGPLLGAAQHIHHTTRTKKSQQLINRKCGFRNVAPKKQNFFREVSDLKKHAGYGIL